MTADWKRLGVLARRRRKELHLNQGDIARLSGPSAALVRQVENGRYKSAMQDGLRNGYEDALHWERGSIQRILDGGDPTPVPVSSIGFVNYAAHRETAVSNPTAEELSVQYSYIVSFAYTLRELDPDLGESALALMFQAAHLYGRAIRLVSAGGGDGDADSTGGSAPIGKPAGWGQSEASQGVVNAVNPAALTTPDTQEETPDTSVQSGENTM